VGPRYEGMVLPCPQRHTMMGMFAGRIVTARCQNAAVSAVCAFHTTPPARQAPVAARRMRAFASRYVARGRRLRVARAIPRLQPD